MRTPVFIAALVLGACTQNGPSDGPPPPDAVDVLYVSAKLDGPTNDRWPFSVTMEPFCDATQRGDSEAARRPIALSPPEPEIENRDVEMVLSGRTPAIGLYKGRILDGRDCIDNGERYGFHTDIHIEGLPEAPYRFTEIITGPPDLADTVFRI
ncbi:MAG: hypothetical protein AAF311_12795, partial [Pseudomonadota bacterium]